MGQRHSMFVVACIALSLCVWWITPSWAQDVDATVTSDAPVTLYPDANRAPLTVLTRGTTVKVVQRNGEWAQVSFRDPVYGQRVGYVRADLLQANQKASAAVAPAVGISSPGAESSQAPHSTDNPKPAAPAPEARNNTAATTTPLPTETTSPAPTATPAPENRHSGATLNGLDRGAVDQAIRLGTQRKGRPQGLVLVDSAQQFAAALGTAGAKSKNGFHLLVYTPLAWIQQLASDAAKEYRHFDEADVPEEAAEQVLRVVAYPDTPNTVTATGMAGTSSVRHVVLRDEARRIVVQPTFKEEFTEETSNAMGGHATFTGLRLKFSMDAVRELRGPNGDREFFITVIGTSGEEKDFRVKKKHFDDLPDGGR